MHNGRRDEQDKRRIDVTADIMETLSACKDSQVFESALQRQQRLAGLGLLVASIAHEINNPLTAVINYAQAIADSVPLSREEHAYSAEILRNSAWISALVQNMLVFVREGPRRSDPVNMLEIVNASLLLVRSFLRKNEVKIAVHCLPDLPLVVCRSQEIQQVLINLLTNSCDAVEARYPSPDPNKIVSLSLQVVSGDGRAWVRTTVEDRGVGIAPEVQARIFEPLFTGKAETGGTGLGLWICQRIATSHEGSLSVESEAGQFTRFHLDLPVDGEVHERQIRLLEQPESDDACDGPKPAAGRAPEAGRKTDEGRAVS